MPPNTTQVGSLPTQRSQEGVFMFSLKHQTILLIAGVALAMAGCGDDDGGTDNPGTNPDAGGGGDGDPTGADCPDHPSVTEMNGVCVISGGSGSEVTQDLTLTADKAWFLNGAVFIGDDAGKTVLTIEAGTTIQGGDTSFLLIQRGSQIMAEGTADKPIVMTSALPEGERGSSDWGGLIINGKAPLNYGANNEAEGEAGTGTFGGTDPADNSGVLKYVRVEYAGALVDAQNELNGIAFQGVGSGTTVDYVQTYLTADDGIEFFGGTVNVKHVVISGADDDSIDWVGGWSGNAQFLVVEQLPDSGMEAERGIEADNLEADPTATPYSDPVLSNVTLVARAGNGATGAQLRRGTKGELHNFIITGFGGPCITVDGDETAANVADNSLVIANHVHNCTGALDGAAVDLAAGANVVTGDPMLDDNWMPMTGSPALGIGAAPAGAFFEAVDYAGAFSATENWAQGWTAAN